MTITTPGHELCMPSWTTTVSAGRSHGWPWSPGRSSDGSFLALYKDLYEALDPAPLLSASLQDRARGERGAVGPRGA
jgi:hypothetical protein